MPTWKRIFLKAAGFGAGAVIAATIIVALLLWYKSRPVTPKPWNRGAITADFYRVSTTAAEGNSKLEIEYVLENKTDKDYELQKYSAPKVAARLEDTNSLTGFADDNEIVLNVPIFVPARQKTRISIIMPSYGFSALTYPSNLSTKDEWDKYYAEVAAHVTKKMANLNGFVLFDENNRYHIELPNGWKKETEENDRKLADKRPVQQKR